MKLARPFAWLVLLAGLMAWRGYADELPQVHEGPPAGSKAEYSVGDYPNSVVRLAAGPGRTKVEAYCSVCHSPTYILMQPPLPRKTWDAEVHKMIKAYGADVPETDAQQIIDYLAAHYSPDTITKTYPPAPK
jgi:hypothetical protein